MFLSNQNTFPKEDGINNKISPIFLKSNHNKILRILEFFHLLYYHKKIIVYKDITKVIKYSVQQKGFWHFYKWFFFLTHLTLNNLRTLKKTFFSTSKFIIVTKKHFKMFSRIVPFSRVLNSSVSRIFQYILFKQKLSLKDSSGLNHDPSEVSWEISIHRSPNTPS